MSSELELSQQEARDLTNRINEHIEAVVHHVDEYSRLVARAWHGRAWESLGYESWDEYCKAEIPVIANVEENRRPVVAALRKEEMSIRAIASATGTGRGTIHRDISTVPSGTVGKITGVNGKTYTVKPKPAPEPPIVDAELEPEETELPTATALPQSDLDELNAEPPTWQPAGHLRDTDLADLKKTKEEPQKPRRTPITDDATRIGWEIRKAAEKLEKLTNDDRWSHNTEKMTPLLRGHLQYVIETATNAINDLTRKDQ